MTNEENNEVEEMVTKLKNSKVLEFCDKPSVRLGNALANRNIRTIYELTKIKNEKDFCRGIVGGSAGWAFEELKNVLESLNLSFGMTDEAWDELEKKNTRNTGKTEKQEETDKLLNKKMELLKNLFSCLIENCEFFYVFDGNMDDMKCNRLTLSFEGEGKNTKFILKSDGSEIFTGNLNNYYMDQCRGGGSPFLFRKKESEDQGIAIKFYHADRFYNDYEDKKLGAKVKSLAKDYYDVWKEDPSTRVRYWNYSQFGYKKIE